jgi:hypothetical protein
MLRQFIDDVIKRISLDLDNGINIFVDTEMVSDVGHVEDMDDNNYLIQLHSITIDPINNIPKAKIELSITSNPQFVSGINRLLDKIENNLDGFDIREIAMIEHLDGFKEANSQAVGSADMGAICYLYEIKI